jgi:MFS family permease
MTPQAQPARPVNVWVVIGFILIPVFVGSLDLTVVSAFLPKLITELGLPFDTALDDASWMITGYLLAYTVSLTFMGRLSDLYGRKAIYAACLTVFMVGSVIVSLADFSLPLLNGSLTDAVYTLYRRMGQRIDPAFVELQVIVFGRVVAALGAGALVPVSLALVGDLFPKEKRAQPLGLVGAVDTLGWVLGPVYGALLLRFIPWQGLFLLNVPLTLLTLFGVLYALRDVQPVKASGRFDYLGTVFIVGALSCLSLGLGGNIDVSGFSGDISDLTPLPPYALPVLSLGAVLFMAFILTESRVKDPLIRLAMFRRRDLSLGAIANFFIGYALFIGLVSVPILVNLRAGDTSQLDNASLEVGVLLSTLTIPMALATVPGGWLSERIGARLTILAGLGLSLLGFVWMWQTWAIDLAYSTIGLQMVLVGVGIGLTFSPVSASILNNANDDERGVAGALVLILRLVGMTVSVASLSSIMLFRVSYLTAIEQQAQGVFDAGGYAQLYIASAVQVLREMGLIGAVMCACALAFAFFLSRGRAGLQALR